MTRTLALVAIATSAGLGYDEAVAFVSELSPTLPADDLEAGRVVATRATERVWV